jgi:hypothetical protein
MSAEPLSLAFTGHMVDLPGRSPPRFPPEFEDVARIEIERRIARHTEGCSKTSAKGFASLARGGDILFHEICRNFGFGTVIVLPFPPDLFLKTSVEGAEGGDWPQRFQKLWDETPPARRYVLGLPKPMTLTPFATSASYSLPSRMAPCSSSLFGMGVAETVLAEPQTSSRGPSGSLAGARHHRSERFD